MSIIIDKPNFLPLAKKRYYDMALSPDGRYLAVMATDPKIIFDFVIWDVYEQQIVRSFKPEDAVHEMHFSPDGKYIAIRFIRGDLGIFDLHGNKIREIIIDLPIIQFAWRPNGKHIAIATYTHRFVVVRAFEDRLPIYRRYCCYGEEDYVYGVAWHPDGKKLAVMHDMGLSIYEMPLLTLGVSRVSYEGMFAPTDCNPPVLYSPDGKYIVVFVGIGKVYDSESLEKLVDMFISVPGRILSFAWCKDPRYGILVTNRNSIVLWDFLNSEVVKNWKININTTLINRIILHPNEKEIFVLYRKYGILTLHI